MIINGLIVGYTFIAVYNILTHKNGIKNSLVWIVIAFVFGYRTIEPSSGLKLHPIEILTYAACIRILIFKCEKYYIMPRSILLIGILFSLHFMLDVMTRYSWLVLLEFKNSILLVGIFFIALHIKFDRNNLKSILKYFVYTITAISLLGITEFIFPAFMRNIFGYDNTQNIVNNDLLFSRVAFLFWGSHLGANLIPPVFPIMLYLRSENEKLTQNSILLTSSIFINLFAIYLSGNRISWLIITIYLILMLLIYRAQILPYMKIYAIMVVIGFVIYIYSQPVEGRYISTFRALSGNIDQRYDSSGAARMYRANIAINSIKHRPMGTGWGSQGWVHSDILQIGASLGIVTAVIFIMSPILLLLNIYRVFNKASPTIHSGLFLCILLLIYTIISFLINGNILKVQTGAPLYVAWAISYTFYMHLNSLRMRT